MGKINLRDFYPFCNADFFVEIPNEIKDDLLEAECLEQNYIISCQINFSLSTAY